MVFVGFAEHAALRGEGLVGEHSLLQIPTFFRVFIQTNLVFHGKLVKVRLVLD